MDEFFEFYLSNELELETGNEVFGDFGTLPFPFLQVFVAEEAASVLKVTDFHERRNLKQNRGCLDRLQLKHSQFKS